MLRALPVLVLLLLAGSAGVASGGVSSDGDEGEKVLVLGTAETDGAQAALFASFGGEGLCLSTETSGDGACGDTGPAAGDTWARDTDLDGSRFREDADEPYAPPMSIGGATSPDVAIVEYVMPGRRTARVETVPAPASLAGTPGARLRWFLTTLPRQPYTRRLLDASGQLLQEEDAEEPGRPPVVAPRLLLSGGKGGATWRISGSVEQVLAPVRGAPGRRERAVCVGHSRRNADGSTSSGSASCHLRGTPLASGVPDPACGAKGETLVYGLATPGEVPSHGILGDGRRALVRVARLSGAFRSELRAWAVVVPPRMALRSIVVGGRRESYGLQPSQLNDCSSIAVFSWDTVGGAVLGGDVAVAVPGQPALAVRDRDAQLCVAVAAPTREGDCDYPWPGIGSMVATGDGARFGAAVDVRVRAVRVTLSTGRTIDVPTVGAGAYTGAYAAHVGFVSYAAPAGARIVRASALDLEGRPAGSGWTAEPQLTGPTSTLLGARAPGGAFQVRARGFEPRGASLSACFWVTPRQGDACTWVTTGFLTGTVDCRHRAAVLMTQVTRRTAAVILRLRDGSERRARIRRARDGTRVAIAIPPPDATVRQIDVRSRSGRLQWRFGAPVPPATAQCGYEIGVLGASPEDGRLP